MELRRGITEGRDVTGGGRDWQGLVGGRDWQGLVGGRDWQGLVGGRGRGARG